LYFLSNYGKITFMSLLDTSLYPLPSEGDPPRVIILRGIPASGKSTFCKAHLSTYPSGSVFRINNDELATMLFGSSRGGSSVAGAVLSQARMDLLRIALAKPDIRLVFIDNTNLQLRTVDGLANLAISLGAQVDVDDRFLTVPIEECLLRDANREYPVGESVVRNMAQKARQVKPWKLKEKFSLDAFLLEVKPYDNDESLPSAMIVDIDGTLADMGTRDPFAWPLVGDDTPRAQVVKFVKERVASGCNVIIMSGREDVCRAETQGWLDSHVAPGLPLYMRRWRDERKDSVVKHELFQTYIAGKYHIDLVLDDRASVVRLWRKLGFNCWQVAEGDF
jgi:predicted kinase